MRCSSALRVIFFTVIVYTILVCTALRARGHTVIRGAESAAISFPEFFDLLDRVTER